MALLATVPWRGGIVAGAIIYVSGFAAFAVLTTEFGANMDGLGIAAELVLGIVSFVAPSDLVMQVIPPGEDVSQEWVSGQYDSVFGLLYLIVPFLLYLTGRKFAEWNATDRDGVDTYLASGATVVFGTLPVAVGLELLAGGNVVRSILVAGLGLPLLAAGFGALVAWTFRSVSRSASYGAGIFTGLLGYVLVFVISLASIPGLAIQAIGLGPLLLGALIVFVNVTLFSVGAGGMLPLLGVALPLVALGFFRASRGPDATSEPLEAARVGASLVAGFSTLAVFAVVVYTVVTSSAVTGLPTAATPGGLAPIATPAALLQAVLVAGVVFPVVFGGVGGAIAGYLAGGTGTGGLTRRQPGPGTQPGQPRQQGRQPPAGRPQGTQPVQGQAPAQSPPPAGEAGQSQPQGQSGRGGQSQSPENRGGTNGPQSE
jgi:hypothetical protein